MLLRIGNIFRYHNYVVYFNFLSNKANRKINNNYKNINFPKFVYDQFESSSIASGCISGIYNTI